MVESAGSLMDYYSITYLQNRIRNTISSARIGRVIDIAGGWRDHLVTFSHPITDGQIVDLRAKNLDAVKASRNQIRIVLPESWLKKPVVAELDFEPLVIGPRAVNNDLVALTSVCHVCQCQYETNYTKKGFERNPSDAYALHNYHQCCRVCTKIERGRKVIAVQPLLSIAVTPEPITLPPFAASTSEVLELISAAEGVLAWYRTLPYSHIGAPHRRLANALVPFHQKPAMPPQIWSGDALEIVK